MLPDRATRRFAAARFEDGAGASRADDVVVEEPLEIRISGETLAITMRTPGHDRELVAGFLLAEGIIRDADDLATLAHCRGGRLDEDARDNTIDVTLAPGVRPPIDAESGMLARRGTLIASSCGVCGRRSIDDLLARVSPLPPGPPVARDVLLRAAASLRDAQPIFARTGGCHAAALVATAEGGAPPITFEDVGRHNAVDKAIGSRLLARELPLAERALVVSGRASFEIVQKAFAAGVRVVAAVSAPSSLAVELALRANVTLAAFVRGRALTVYSAEDRLAR